MFSRKPILVALSALALATPQPASAEELAATPEEKHIGLLVPAVQKVRDAAARTQDKQAGPAGDVTLKGQKILQNAVPLPPLANPPVSPTALPQAAPVSGLKSSSSLHGGPLIGTMIGGAIGGVKPATPGGR